MHIFSTSLTLTDKKICLKIISETNAERQFKLPNLKLKTVFWYVTEIRIYRLNLNNIKRLDEIPSNLLYYFDVVMLILFPSLVITISPLSSVRYTSTPASLSLLKVSSLG